MSSEQPIPLSEYHRLPQESLPTGIYKRQLEVICNNATVALFIMDEHQQCVYMNPAAETLTGYSLSEVKGRILHDVIHHTRPDGQPYPLCECPIDRAFPQNNQERGEEVFVHKNGDFYPVAYTASPIREGEITTGTIIEVQDIRQHKQAEAELQQAHDALAQQAQQLEQANVALKKTLSDLQAVEEELRQQNEELIIAREITEAERYRYQDLFDFAPDGYVVTDASGIIQEANQHMTALLGVEQRYLLHTPLAIYFRASDHQTLRNLMIELCQQPGQLKMQTDELSLHLSCGSEIPVAITGRVTRNSQAQIVEIRWLIQDITERKKVEIALREKENKLQQLSDSMPQFVWISSPNGELEYINRQWVVYSGLTLQQTADQTQVQALYHPDDRQLLVQQWTTCLEKQQPLEIEARIRRASDGAYRWFLIRTIPSFNEQGQLIQWYGTSTDIHEHKQARLNESFLSQLELRLRRQVNADAMVWEVLSSLGDYLQVDRCLWHGINEVEGLAIVEQDWCRHEMSSVIGVYSLAELMLPELIQHYRLGQPAIIPDVLTYSYTAPFAENYLPSETRALIAVPCLCEGQWVAVLTVASKTMRDWRPEEVELLQDIVVRLWSIIEQTRAIQALRESEERLQMALEGSGSGFWSWDVVKDQGYTSFRWLEMLGYDAGELQLSLRNLRELIHPEEQDWVMAQITAHLQDSSVAYDFEYRLQTKTGEWKWIASYGKVVKWDEQGKPLLMAGIHQDISARKQIEAELKESERRFRRLVESNMFGVAFGDFNGSVHYTNDYFLNMIGYTREEVEAGQVKWTDITPEESLHLDEQAFEELKVTGIATPFEKEYIRKNGTRIPILIGSALLDEPYDEKQEIIGFFLDLTERKQSEEQLRQALQKLNFHVENTPMAVIEWDAEFRVTRWSGTAEQIFGWQAHEILGQALSNLRFVFEEDAEKTTEVVNKLLQGEAAYVFSSNRNYTKQGAVIHCEWYNSSLRDSSGRMLSVLSLVLDVTEQKQAEAERDRLLRQEQAARKAAESANRIKDEFLAVLSHELRSPLNPILGWSKLLRNRQLNEQKTDYALQIIERNAQMQAQLINDLLDVSCILQGKLSLDPGAVNLGTTIQAAIETVRLAAEAKSIQIQTVIDPNVGTVWGDAGRLQQVVWNLLSNAVKFTPQGGRIEVRLEPRETQAQLEVKDTGKGILPDFLPYVFDNFRQEDAATTRRFGGLGLGLAISRHLVELHGGTIQADSLGEGQGSTFTVKLPLMQRTRASVEGIQSSQLGINLQGLRIVVVDDEQASRELIAFLLELQGATVATAASAIEALAQLNQIQPDLLLSDIGMPDMDGYMLIRQVRALPAHQGGQVPAIALTAYAGESDYQQAMSAGFQKHLSKPIEPEILLQAIAELLQSRIQNPASS